MSTLPRRPGPRRATRLLAAALCAVALAAHVAPRLAALPTADTAPRPDAPAWPDVRAVLETRCLTCHGGEDRRSGLSFADATTFGEGGARGPLLDEERPLRSRLLHVVGYRDPELAMPPDGELPDAEQGLLRAWVLAGAPWPEGADGVLADATRHPREEHGGITAADLDWWAYRPLEPVAVPEVASAAGGGAVHPVDAFVAAAAREAGVPLAPPAPPHVRLRRARFALTGLPPTPEERRALETSVAALGVEEAWAAEVDRLLADPGYGEHLARHWLDLVRFAETNGYERDGAKTNIWRYRDQVVRAFQADVPYDRFVLEQLAGDELVAEGVGAWSPETGDPRLATGFYRLGVWDDEPADRLQAAADELADIVDTTSQAFLGTTLGCARCHDHKADPVTQAEYYGFTAWFNNLAGHGGDDFGQHLGGGVTRDVADPPGPGLRDALDRDRELAELDAALGPHLAALRAAVAGEEVDAPTVLLDDAREAAVTWRHHEGEPPEGWQLQAFDDAAWPEAPGGFGTEGTPGAHVRTRWATDRIQLRTRFRLLEVPRAVVLRVHHDEDVAVWLNGVLAFEATGYRTDYREVQLPRAARDALVVGSNVIAVSCRQTGGGQYVDVGLRAGWTDAPEAWVQRLRLDGARVLPPAAASEALRLLGERDRLLAQPVAEAYPALVAVERGGTAPAQHVLLRGSAHVPGDVVAPSVPAAFLHGATGPPPEVPTPPPGASSTGRRLALARWLVTDGRHVTARVAANRLWQVAFGRGLCRSAGDFGRLGERPTHPALLDHLARTFVEQGWSTRAFLRLLLTSETWCRDADGSAAVRAADPRNDLLARADPRRLTAEQYRDAVLAVSGDLDRARGGPSVYPPLPEEVLATASRPGQAWPSVPGDPAHRRSLYVFTKRSLRVPLFEAFDQPDPDLPCAVRFPTNVPTQALMTLNGAFVHGQAARFAARLLEEVGAGRDTVSEVRRIERGVELALGRPADPAEVARYVCWLEGLRAGGPRLSHEEALEAFCLLLFNLNEFLWVS